MANKISVIIDVAVDKGVSSLKKFRSAIGEAETASGKMRAGFDVAKESIVANAANIAMAAGGALIAFGVKSVKAFQDTALAAGQFSDATGLAVDEASRFILHKFDGLVVFDAVRHISKVRNTAAHSFRKHPRNVAQDVHRVLASKLHVRREAKVFTNQHAVADADASGKAFVVRVAQAKHKFTVRGVDIFPDDGKAAEVTLAHAGKRVFFFLD